MNSSVVPLVEDASTNKKIKLNFSKFFLAVYFLTSIALFFFPDGSIRLLLLAIMLGSSWLLFLSAEKSNFWVAIVIIVLMLIFFDFLNKILFERVTHVTLLLNLLAGFFVSYAIVVRRNLLSTIYILYFFLVVGLLSILLYGVDAGQIFSGSRNTISMILVCFGSIFLLSNYGKGRFADITLYSLVLLVCILSFGRSGILTAFILFCAVIFKYWTPKTYDKVILSSLFMVIVVALGLFFYDASSYFDYLKSKGLDDSYRLTMLIEYINSLDLENLFFGTDLSTLPYIASFNLNPHNTFLLLHSHFGVLFLVFSLVITSFFLSLVMYCRVVASLAFVALVFRLATDSSTDITTMPLVFCFLLVIKQVKWRGHEKPIECARVQSGL